MAKWYLEQTHQYYPTGGTGDMVGPFDTRELAIAAIEDHYDGWGLVKVENDEIELVAVSSNGTDWNVPYWFLEPDKRQPVPARPTPSPLPAQPDSEDA